MTQEEIKNEILKKLRCFDVEKNKTDNELLRIFNERTMLGGEKRAYQLSEMQKLDFLYFAERNSLNPFYDIWACSIGGIVRPYILIDGWHNILKKHIKDGAILSVEWNYSEIKKLIINNKQVITYEWIECILVFKDGRKFPLRTTIYDNFVASNPVWEKHTGKMLQNKALSNALRMYVSKERLYDDDEIQKIKMSFDVVSSYISNSAYISENVGDLIRSLKQLGGNIKKIFFSQDQRMLCVQSSIDSAMIMKEKNFFFDKESGLWQTNINIENENDLDVVLTQNRIPYESKRGVGAGSNKLFYQVKNVNDSQKQLLTKIGFEFFPQKGFIKSI